MQPGITLRDLVNAIPLYAIKRGLLTVEKQGKKNIFSGRILEIEGLPDLKVEQAFELSDASAERSAGGCTVHLNKEPIIEYMRSNITLMKWMIANGYEDARTLGRRIKAMEAWIANPQLLKADANADYAEIIEIDINEIKEPILACPNDPDDVKFLSEVSGTKIDEVFIGSCMTNIGHFRAAGKVLEGKTDALTRRLEGEMQELSTGLKFEEAAAVRDRIRGLRAYSEKQKVAGVEEVDRDIFAFAADGAADDLHGGAAVRPVARRHDGHNTLGRVVEKLDIGLNVKAHILCQA
jgi:hypothetical protein